MVPKKASDHIEPTAKQLGVSQDLVQDLTSFYWSDVRKSLVELRGHNIYIENIGTFKIKHWKLDEIEQNYKDTIAKYQERQESKSVTFQRFSIIKDLQTQVDRIHAIREGLKQDEIKKEQVRAKRYEPKTNMDTPEADL